MTAFSNRGTLTVTDSNATITEEGQDQKPAEQPQGERVVCKCSSSFPQILSKLGISVLISTYQAGHVIVARAEAENKLSTVFRRFQSPMGIALGRKHIAIGTRRHIWEYRNNPSVSKRLDPAGKNDVVFMPSNCKVTGDIRIHEMAYIGDELWFANTRFSCLATMSPEHSFVPKWRPPFITALAAEDRCHLNGLAVRDGKVAYVTALGTTDTVQGWRDNKAHGGVIMEVPSGKVIVNGLSMPHSPRWYRDHLWVLESGKGTLAKIGPGGEVITVAELPGFTRGLSFVGPFAFIGLSRVRETNVFGGIQLNDRVEEKQCGVAVVDTRNGKVVAMLRFESGVAEIFAVELIRGKWPDLVDNDSDLVATSFIVPPEAAKDIKQTAKPEAETKTEAAASASAAASPPA